MNNQSRIEFSEPTAIRAPARFLENHGFIPVRDFFHTLDKINMISVLAQTFCATLCWSHLTLGRLLGFLDGVGTLLLSAFITSSM